MKIDFKKIINIKNKAKLKLFPTHNPIFHDNYLFHYLILVNNLDGLKLTQFPIYKVNNNDMNGFMLAANEDNMEILSYLITTYPDYIYNRNSERKSFANFLEIERFSVLINKFPKLNWDDLIDNMILRNIVYNLNYKELTKFLQVYTIKPTYTNMYLLAIVNNVNINTDEKIKILDNYNDMELNIKNQLSEGLILAAIALDDIKLFDYLLDHHVDVNYYTWHKTNSPLKEAIRYDIINKNKYTKKLLAQKFDITSTDKMLDNILHTLFYIRLNNMNNINYDVDFSIMEIVKDRHDMWNQLNINKHSPLEIIAQLDYKVYSPYIIKNNIMISKDTIKKIDAKSKWFKLYSSLPPYNMKDDINMIEKLNYADATLFQATFRDLNIFIIYLKETYKDLFIPIIPQYMVNDITFEDSMPIVDKSIIEHNIYPWIINYYSEDEYYIHPYLNNIINGERRKNDKRFVLVFLSLITDKIMHANVLIYDFKNMTIERFEPYGNVESFFNNMDDILEEELTWSTGLQYIRPKDYEPMVGFQSISDENNLANLKAGDYGGFCLAWSLWYVEHRMKNPNVNIKVLVEKLLNKLTNNELKFSEYIRNYANKINEKRIKYMKLAGFNEKEISNLHMNVMDDNKLTDFLIKYHQN